ncbi:MAG TPA: roadblock/LC7 domain-containing protein, partial [Planctomycetota bacterium]|nr:roadblock/LC7 domain-containing protein [Planctomycetota bacterium]
DRRRPVWLTICCAQMILLLSLGKKVATGMSDDEKPKRLVFYKEDIEKIAKTLDAFRKNAKVNCILLVDKDGHLITKQGESSTHNLDTISGLVAGSFAAFSQTAKLIGEKPIPVLQRRGDRETIDFYLVGDRTILAVVLNGNEHLGMIQIYGSQVAAKLTELFNDIARRGRKGPGASGGTRLDDVFQ